MSHSLLLKGEFPGSASPSLGSLVMAFSIHDFYDLSAYTHIPVPWSLRYVSSEKPQLKETWDCQRWRVPQKHRVFMDV